MFTKIIWGKSFIFNSIRLRRESLRADPAVQARIEELAEKCNEGTITPEEISEHDAYIQAMDVVAVLQKKARSLIVPPHAS
jgi:hypothetical protein